MVEALIAFLLANFPKVIDAFKTQHPEFRDDPRLGQREELKKDALKALDDKFGDD